MVTIEKVKAYKAMLTTLNDDELVAEICETVAQSRAGIQDSLFTTLAQKECENRNKIGLFYRGYKMAETER